MNFKEWIVEDHTDRGSGIFFTDGKSVLLLKRSSDSNEGETWCLPGGHAKGDETPLETAKREATEEVGQAEGKNLGSIVRDGWWTTFFFYTKPFECKLNDEHTEWEWVAFDDLKDYPLLSDLKKDLPEYFDKLQQLSS
jgi:8-oxo-dGTP pyrophosphatase MutT (NUDIX family)